MTSAATRLDPDAVPGQGPRDRVARQVQRLIVPALGIYLAFRVVSAVIMTWIAHHQAPDGVPGGPSDAGHVSYWDISRMWDGEWYRRIATDGYPHEVPRDDQGRAEQSALAFYPLYPFLVRLGLSLTGGSFGVVAGLLALVLGCAVVPLMLRLLVPRIGALASLCVVAVYASSPPSPTLQMAYTEALAMLLLCGMLLALEREEWLTAAALAVAIGLARPIGVPLAAVAFVVIGLRWWRREDRSISPAEYARMAVCLVSCTVSGFLWLLITWRLTGERHAYDDTMGAWRVSRVVRPFEQWFKNFDVLFGHPLGVFAVIGVVIAMTVLIAGPWASRLGVVMTTWCAAYSLYLFAVLDPWSSTYRYLLELFPLAAVLIGVAGRRCASRRTVPVTVVAVILNVVLQAYWAWHFLRLVPPSGNPI